MTEKPKRDDCPVHPNRPTGADDGRAERNEIMKKLYIKQRLDSVRWQFFAFTRLGKALTHATVWMWDHHPNRVTEWLFLFCLPF